LRKKGGKEDIERGEEDKEDRFDDPLLIRQEGGVCVLHPHIFAGSR